MNILRNFLRRSFQNTRKFRRLDLRERMMRIHEADSKITKSYTLEETDCLECEVPYRDKNGTLMSIVRVHFVAYRCIPKAEEEPQKHVIFLPCNKKGEFSYERNSSF